MTHIFCDPESGQYYYTAGEVAKLIGVTIQRVHQIEKCGGLPCIRSSRNYRLFRKEDVADLVKKRKTLEEARAALRGRQNEAEIEKAT